MDSLTLPDLALHLRSYGRDPGADRHAYAQLVLPLAGAIRLDIDGHADRLDPLRGACVAPGAWHSQTGDAGNRALILDVAAESLHGAPWERLLERRFMPLGPAARKLVEFMGLMGAQHAAGPATLRGWTPLLLDALTLAAPRPASRLAALLARMEAAPGLAWTTESMANAAGLSVSRLHALFRTELDTSPRAWLQALRLAQARAWLAGTARPIADIALAAGFSDQSALTRALRNATGMTPAAYRRTRGGSEQ